MEVVEPPMINVIGIMALFILSLVGLGAFPAMFPGLLLFFFGVSVAGTPVISEPAAESPAYQSEYTQKKGPAVVLPAEPIRQNP